MFKLCLFIYVFQLYSYFKPLLIFNKIHVCGHIIVRATNYLSERYVGCWTSIATNVSLATLPANTSAASFEAV
jgi:hypothetical protein